MKDFIVYEKNLAALMITVINIFKCLIKQKELFDTPSSF